jgi:hypothetical protein
MRTRGSGESAVLLLDVVDLLTFAGGPLGLVDAARAIAGADGSLDFALLRRLACRYGRDAGESLERLLAGFPSR